MDPRTEMRAVELMERLGGDFAQAIAKAWGKADKENRLRLRAAFPELLEQYADMLKHVMLRHRSKAQQRFEALRRPEGEAE